MARHNNLEIESLFNPIRVASTDFFFHSAFRIIRRENTLKRFAGKHFVRHTEISLDLQDWSRSERLDGGGGGGGRE